ncbi:unnamed protein product [Fraxinus pennsylvanica]|uniref:Uncharacterized protein n=1 Tax=Fraxinus pennsylvanica TaxID=56036 RepID=A0AAD2E3M9_9LAMI|nr:unnamed protein product [Fraxinus pennsylvanica]
MELSLIGLQNAGKTSLVNVIVVGFNMRKVTKGNVTIKWWDLGGQPRFRSMWERCCRAVSAIVYVGFNMRKVTKGNVTIKWWDLGGQPRFRSMWERCCRAVSAIVISKSELHDLLSKPALNGIPLLVLGNKNDKPQALSKQGLTDQMDLKSISDREVCCYMISCKNSTNINQVIDWVIKHSKSKS